MSEGLLEGLAGAEELEAAARSRTYAAFCAALAYPDGEALEDIRSGRLADALRACLEAAGSPLAASANRAALADAGDADDALAVEYTRLFDVGPSGPPCPLYGGLYGGDRMKTMEEAVRFYEHFGLGLAESPRELPDHLSTQLEFLHYLAFREAEALHAGLAPDSYRRAQRDFVARQPGRWVPRLLVRLKASDPAPFFQELFRLLAGFLEEERERLVRLAGPVPTS